MNKWSPILEEVDVYQHLHRMTSHSGKLLIFILLLILHVQNSHAAVLGFQASNRYSPTTFNVDSVSDDVDVNIGDGVCATPKGLCTLRAAIQEANASFNETVIILRAGTYRLTIPGSGEDKAASGDLDITSPLTIQGSAEASTIIEGGGLDRVFDIGENIHPGTQVVIKHLIVRDGTDNGDNAPGGIRIRSYKVTLDYVVVSDNIGEGIGLDKGTLTLKNSLVKNNNNVGVGGIRATSSSLILMDSIVKNNSGAWGGISSDTSLNISNSTVSGNKGSAGPGGLRISGNATITNSTISSNSGSEGAGIWMNSGNLFIINSTITANAASGVGSDWRSGTAGGIFFKDDKGSVILTHTILAENSSSSDKPNCAGTILSKGYNLIGDLSGCHFMQTPTDKVNTQAMLAPLQDNSGTHALMLGSPAIDAGDAQGCTYRDKTPLTRDQRQHPRPFDGNYDGVAICDIGAYEFDAPANLPPSLPTLLSPTTKPTCSQLIVNGGFENQDGWTFPLTTVSGAYDHNLAHTGKQSARLGIISLLHNELSYSSVWQQVTIPADTTSATYSFWAYPLNTGPIEDYRGGDLQLALLLDYPYWSIAPSPLRETLLSIRSDNRTWTFYEFDLAAYAGRTLWLYFGTYNNGWTASWGSSMAMFIDDVSLRVCK